MPLHIINSETGELENVVSTIKSQTERRLQCEKLQYINPFPFCVHSIQWIAFMLYVSHPWFMFLSFSFFWSIVTFSTFCSQFFFSSPMGQLCLLLCIFGALETKRPTKKYPNLDALMRHHLSAKAIAEHPLNMIVYRQFPCTQ